MAPAAYAPPAQHYAPPVPQDVEIHATQPKVAHYATPAPLPQHRPDVVDAGPYIPPAPSLPQRPQRMPQVEDLPVVVQNQIRSSRGEAMAEASPAESKRRTLLERLASFGMSRHDEQAAPVGKSPQQAPRPPGSMHHAAPPQLTGGSYAPSALPPASVHAEYGKRIPNAAPSRQAAVDQHGRPAPLPRQAEDDQLEIPAFLRRQSN